jgi:branched-chain amino acid transport system substrate-binding protein
MAKYALLIGVSEYPPGLNSLPGVKSDMQAVERVLNNSEICDFDQVALLFNPNPQNMRVEIEILFSNKQKDDIVLLYFSGHGITDENGRLYFSTTETRRNSTGELIKATTVEASFIQHHMADSRSRRQILILDCCFSGAFAEGLLARDGGIVDIRNQLGGEGRAILTSSTSIQYSFEGVYTRYIVEGLETGAADRDRDGDITIDELHDYARTRVQESGQPMSPQIFAIREGFRIVLASVPVEDSRLEYRREVEYLLTNGNGQISELGRDTLSAIRDRLGLSNEEATEIEEIALQPFEEYREKLQRYNDGCVRVLSPLYQVSDQIRHELQRFQRALGLRDEDVALIENRIIEEKRKNLQNYEQSLRHALQRRYPLTEEAQSNLNNLQKSLTLNDKEVGVIRESVIKEIKRNRKTNLLRFIGLPAGAIAFFGAGVFSHNFIFSNIPPNFNPLANYCQTNTFPERGLRISLGDLILLKGDTNNYKEAGVQAFSKKDYKAAAQNFILYRTQSKCINDPEALIYLNNARALQTKGSFRIAVSVPVGENTNVAKEILRGVAQAQDKIDSTNKINGKLLQVKIANDNNNESLASNVAEQFVADSSILAVVGHNTSNASTAAANVYQAGKLTMISPTSFTNRLSGFGNYIFRTVPSQTDFSSKLAEFIVKKSNKNSIVICYDQKALEFDLDDFVNNFRKYNIKISTQCNLDTIENPADMISKAIKNHTDALVLVPYVNNIDRALVVARAVAQVSQKTQKVLALFSTSTMYTNQTLEEGKDSVNNLILVTPWHAEAFPASSFPQDARKLWGGDVSWRTAMAYDATMAIAKALQKNATRDGLQQELHKISFNGATGKVEFLESGDRKFANVRLAQVQPTIETSSGYEFVLLEE